MEGSSNHPLGWTAGAIVDSVLGYLGILLFRDSLIASWLCPPWLIALWLIFATTFQSSLSWLAGRYWIAAVSGGIFGPVSYYAGQALGALTGGVRMGLRPRGVPTVSVDRAMWLRSRFRLNLPRQMRRILWAVCQECLSDGAVS